MPIPTIPYLGESFSLITAIVWASAVILFKRSGESVHPIGLNLFKNVLALVLFIPTIWLFGEVLFYPAPLRDYLIIMLSGAIGIGVADTLYFQCLNRVGAGLTAIIACLYSPAIIIMSTIWLGESLSVWQIVGVLMIISAVLVATPLGNSHGINRKTLLIGLAYGAISILLTAIGIVIVKPVLEYSPLIWVTEIRLLAGVLVLWLMLAFHPHRKSILSSIKAPQGRVFTVSGSFTGADVAMVFWLAGMKYTQASTAAALNQTSNVFIFLLAAIFLHEKITTQRSIGIALGVGGALLVTFGS